VRTDPCLHAQHSRCIRRVRAASRKPRLAAEEVVDSLLQLVQKHLVMRIDARQGMAHYALLETLRQYALDKLLERDRELSAAQERHAAYYSTLAERLDAASATTLLPFSGETLTAPVFDILDDAHDNVQLALKWWLDSRRATEGLVLIRALVPLWHWRAVRPGGLRWVEATLDLAAETPGVPPALHAQALMFGGMLAQMQAGAARARAFLEASVKAWRTLGDRVGLAVVARQVGS
jgi:predicted ATPase